jgi:hypothetical protein
MPLPTFSQVTSIIPTKSIKGLVFIMESSCVFIRKELNFKSHAFQVSEDYIIVVTTISHFSPELHHNFEIYSFLF